jgi:hypothetical protein
MSSSLAPQVQDLFQVLNLLLKTLDHGIISRVDFVG